MLIDVLKPIGSVTVIVESVPEILADFPNCKINPLLNRNPVAFISEFSEIFSHCS